MNTTLLLTAIHLSTDPLALLAEDFPRGSFSRRTRDTVERDYGALGHGIINIHHSLTVSVDQRSLDSRWWTAFALFGGGLLLRGLGGRLIGMCRVLVMAGGGVCLVLFSRPSGGQLAVNS